MRISSQNVHVWQNDSFNSVSWAFLYIIVIPTYFKSLLLITFFLLGSSQICKGIMDSADNCSLHVS